MAKDSVTPGSKSNGSLQLWRLALQLGFVAVMGLGIIGMFLAFGKEVSTEFCLGLIAALGGLAGLVTARFFADKGGPGAGITGAAGGLLLVFASMLCVSGCEGSAQVPATQCTAAVLECAGRVASACWPREGDVPASTSRASLEASPCPLEDRPSIETAPPYVDGE